VLSEKDRKLVRNCKLLLWMIVVEAIIIIIDDYVPLQPLVGLRFSSVASCIGTMILVGAILTLWDLYKLSSKGAQTK